MKLLDTRNSSLKYAWRFPTSTASLEFVVDLAMPVPAKGLVALISLADGASVTSEAWGFSKSLAGHYRYLELDRAGALVLPVITLDREISDARLSILPWGTKQLAPKAAVASVWSIATFNALGTPGLSVISKGKLLTND
ncbi:hypothetical protein AB4Y72_16095 [Arthrobacter sp. YAF34]|uniref:hypothetical protein n=1 Tax=Arthrobacter sp. YAF34 TaxID=3233083 RepID=UPI003F912ACC